MFRSIEHYLFGRLRYKNVSLINFESIINLVYVIAISQMTIAMYWHFYPQVPKDAQYYNQEVLMLMYEKDLLKNIGLQPTFAVCLGIQFIHCLMILKASRTFGPMIEIIMSMLKEVAKFAVVQGAVILIFFSSGRLLFFTFPQYDTPEHTIATLFSASLGDFDFTIFDDPNFQLSKYYGYGVLMLFLGISTVTLLNFLIAIISNVYDRLRKISIGLYLTNIIEIRKIQQNDKRFSSLVSAVPPLNVLTFLLTPLILWCESKKLNSFLLHLCYLPVLFVGTITFLV